MAFRGTLVDYSTLIESPGLWLLPGDFYFLLRYTGFKQAPSKINVYHWALCLGMSGTITVSGVHSYLRKGSVTVDLFTLTRDVLTQMVIMCDHPSVVTSPSRESCLRGRNSMRAPDHTAIPVRRSSWFVYYNVGRRGYINRLKLATISLETLVLGYLKRWPRF